MYVLINVKKTIVEWVYYLDTTSLMSVFTYFVFYFCYECVCCNVVIETLYKSDFTHYKIHKVTKWLKDYCLPSREPLCNSNFIPEMHSFSDIRRQKWRDLAIRVRGHSRSYELTPIDHYDDQSATCDFLHEPMSHRFRDKRRFPLKIANFPTPCT